MAFTNSTPPVVIGTIEVIASEDNGTLFLNPTSNAYDPDVQGLVIAADIPTDLPPGLVYDVQWHWFVLDTSAAAFQSLRAGQTWTYSVTYNVTDGITAVPDTMNFTIHGVNDVAVVSGVQTGSVTEDSGVAATGALGVTDVDTGEAAFVAGTMAGAYGSLVIDATGNWAYSLNNALAAVQTLGAGAVLSDAVTVLTVDGTATQISLTINGADEPVISGTAANDILLGTAAAETLLGLGGRDKLSGGEGADTLNGGSGADSLYGDAGNDTLIFDALDKVQSGGLGVDTLQVATAISINLANADQISGDAGIATGIENVDASAATAVVTLTGSTLANTLTGGGGSDRLTGGRGADVLTGGAGADRFVFASLDDSRAATRDTITDLQHGSDRIDLSAIDAISGGSNNAFKWIGAAAFSAAGQLRYDQSTGVLEADVNGDQVTDFQMLIANNAALSALDIVL